MIHAKRSDFTIEADAKGNRTVSFRDGLTPRSMVIPFDLLRGEVRREGEARRLIAGTFDERAHDVSTQPRR